ncbi:MAG: arsenate reductase (glutaredoxin) [Bdellovibrionales bacterium]|nr:arsenate reductase (glutaredoxin) [Bdellovibrionales bacterium]
MRDVIIFHNPKCSKSRETLELLKSNKIQPEIIEYLKTPLNKDKLLQLMALYKGDVRDFVRTKEDLFKELRPTITNKEEIATLLEKHPKLMERPLVVTSDRAAFGRPPEKVLELLT